MSKIFAVILTIINFAILAVAVILYLKFLGHLTSSEKLFLINYSDVLKLIDENEFYVIGVISLVPGIIFFLRAERGIKILNFLVAIVSIIIIGRIGTSI